MQVPSDRGRFAERELHGVDDAGREERIVVWIERKPGALWAVGRVVNPHLRNRKAMKAGDYVFEGYELEDALEQANAALEDDLTVSERDGRSEHCRPFTREECLKPLEAWFFGVIGLTPFTFRLMTQADAEAVASWHYPDPYGFYDWTSDADDLAELLDPVARERGGYHASDDVMGELVGFLACTMSEGVAQIGLGLRPDRTGRGLGRSFLLAALDWLDERFAPRELTLAVAAFNQRAITVYERAGFRTVRTFRHRTNGAEWDFLELRRSA